MQIIPLFAFYEVLFCICSIVLKPTREMDFRCTGITFLLYLSKACTNKGFTEGGAVVFHCVWSPFKRPTWIRSRKRLLEMRRFEADQHNLDSSVVEAELEKVVRTVLTEVKRARDSCLGPDPEEVCCRLLKHLFFGRLAVKYCLPIGANLQVSFFSMTSPSRPPAVFGDV